MSERNNSGVHDYGVVGKQGLLFVMRVIQTKTVTSYYFHATHNTCNSHIVIFISIGSLALANDNEKGDPFGPFLSDFHF